MDDQEINHQKHYGKVTMEKHVCELCYTGFSSAKALGGHMKAHSRYKITGEESDDYDPRSNACPKRKIKIKSSRSHVNKKMKTVMELGSEPPPSSGIGSPTCALCGKGFPSKKSLFGHMRCHPEREWRGIHPPSIAMSPAPVDWSNLELLADAAVIEYKKLKLSKKRRLQRSALKKHSDLFDEKDHNLHESHDDSLIKEEEKVKLNDVENRVGEAVEYKCSNCQKCFLSHQALGGHRSKHCNNNNNVNVPVLPLAPKDELHEEVLNSSELVLPVFDEICSTGQLHKCQICNKEFPTGQALGGHKRAHWSNPLAIHTEIEGPSHSVEPEKEEAAGGKIVFDFDLNEPFIMEEQETEGILEYQQSNDHA